MIRVTYVYENLKRHNVTTREIDEVFESDLTIAMDMPANTHGNSRAMIIGWTLKGRLLEIGIEYFDLEDREHVFHAMNACSKHRREFERRL